ncbi:hypothetical protein OAK83_01675 [bacterium]|nr:hypothetical protein [bacterium]
MSTAGYLPIKATFYTRKRATRNTYIVRYQRHRVEHSKYSSKSFREGEEHLRDKFISDWNTALLKNNESELSLLTALQKSEINVALKKLEDTGVSILDCVDFYLKINNPVSTKMKISEAVEIFLNNLKLKKVGKTYISDQIHSFLNPFQRYFKNRKILDVSRRDMQKYLFSNKNWSDNNRIIHKRHLSAFFNNLIKDEVLALNPTKGIILPEGSKEKRFYPPHLIWLFLHTCLELKKYKTLAAHVLCAFGGLRLRESTRINFDQIDGQGRVEVYVGQSKTRNRRILWKDGLINFWLKQIPEEKRTGLIANPTSILIGAREVKNHIRDKLKIDFENIQNGFRQAFAAHFYKKYGDLRTLSEVMGNSVDTLKSNYNGIIKNDNDAENYFHLLPVESLSVGLSNAQGLNLWKKKYSANVDQDDLMVVKRSDDSYTENIYSITKWDKFNALRDRYEKTKDPARIQRACIARINNEDRKLMLNVLKFHDRFGFYPNKLSSIQKVSDVKMYLKKNLAEKLPELFTGQ